MANFFARGYMKALEQVKGTYCEGSGGGYIGSMIPPPKTSSSR